MYIWNGYTVIGKHKDLTEGMLKTLDEAQQMLEQYPSKNPSTQLNTTYVVFHFKNNSSQYPNDIFDLGQFKKCKIVNTVLAMQAQLIVNHVYRKVAV